MSLPIPEVYILSPFHDPKDDSGEPDDWSVVLKDKFPGGPLSLCYWRYKGDDSLYIAGRIPEEEWPEYLQMVMDEKGGPEPEDLANDMLARLYGEYRGLPPNGSTEVFQKGLIEWIQQNRAAAAQLLD